VFTDKQEILFRRILFLYPTYGNQTEGLFKITSFRQSLTVNKWSQNFDVKRLHAVIED